MVGGGAPGGGCHRTATEEVIAVSLFVGLVSAWVWCGCRLWCGCGEGVVVEVWQVVVCDFGVVGGAVVVSVVGDGDGEGVEEASEPVDG